jgi:hypothetical protein
MEIPIPDPGIEDRPEECIFPYLGVKRLHEALYHRVINAGALGDVGSDLGSAS